MKATVYIWVTGLLWSIPVWAVASALVAMVASSKLVVDPLLAALLAWALVVTFYCIVWISTKNSRVHTPLVHSILIGLLFIWGAIVLGILSDRDLRLALHLSDNKGVKQALDAARTGSTYTKRYIIHGTGLPLPHSHNTAPLREMPAGWSIPEGLTYSATVAFIKATAQRSAVFVAAVILGWWLAFNLLIDFFIVLFKAGRSRREGRWFVPITELEQERALGGPRIEEDKRALNAASDDGSTV